MIAFPRGGRAQRAQKIGKYEIGDEIGRGATGVVYEARDSLMDRQVALKTLRLEVSQLPDLRARVRREVMERELEDRLIERLRDFILELGYGFCFVGRQHRLTLGKKEYFIDLLFYHRFLKSLAAVELKVGAFEPEFAGKMDFYLNLLNDKERVSDDNPSIGIILCAEKDNLEVEFSLKTKANPIGVAEYQLVPKLPKELKGKLPSERELLEVLRDELPPRRKQ